MVFPRTNHQRSRRPKLPVQTSLFEEPAVIRNKRTADSENLMAARIILQYGGEDSLMVKCSRMTVARSQGVPR